MRFRLLPVLLMLCCCAFSSEEERVPELAYNADLVSFPGPWAFQIPRSSLILVSDDQLLALTNPDQEVDVGLTGTPNVTTLRKVCEGAKAVGARTLIIAFDHFWNQYRPGQSATRELLPDSDAYIQHIATISKFAQQYGLGLELSLLSPLEIGAGAVKDTGESGIWAHYRKGLRDPQTGAYSVQLWRQMRWSNNKGPISLEDAGVRIFAFKERSMGGTPYRVVNPDDIIDISDGAQVEVWEGTHTKKGDYEAVRIRVYGTGHPELSEHTRVLVVQRYKTPEMDYFSEKALPYLNGLVDRYADAGVLLNGLYADEMHIQQDWGYFTHHDNGELALRYVSPGLAAAFASKYGEQYKDFEKYLVYFVHGQEDTANDLSAKQEVMHVMPGDAQGVQSTALMRSRYYKMLQGGVVDLFTAAKHHAETRMGHRLESRAHATWAQSPTIDSWDTGRQPRFANQYEYTSNFVWSNTVQQASAACYDYFKWGDFLTGNGNDHAEGGWLDRNYYGLMLACSTGIINEVPYSYGAHWGMPDAIAARRTAVMDAFGASSEFHHGIVQGMEHRDVDVLMLYPLDLVAVDERFGSWMTQYAYANLITEEKLLELGKLAEGKIELGGRKFGTLVALFQPFPSKALLDLMGQLAAQGGRVIWSGPVPFLNAEGESAVDVWQVLFHAQYDQNQIDGLRLPGRAVSFEGALQPVASETILTDFTPDQVYPVVPAEVAETVARLGKNVVGVHHALEGGGSTTFLGFRPREDQSQSLGHDVAQWFQILSTLGAYPGTGTFDSNDNTEYISRTGDVVACRFPNGAISIAPHLKTLEEGWPGGFFRKQEQDAEFLAKVELPSDRLNLKDYRVNGHTLSYEGRGAVSLRPEAGKLAAFAGQDCSGITVDGQAFEFGDQPFGLLSWAPVLNARHVEHGAFLQVLVYGAGEVRIPLVHPLGKLELVREGATPGSRGEVIPHTQDDTTLRFKAEDGGGRWIYAVALEEEVAP